MANLEGRLIQVGTAIYLTDAQIYFSALNTELQKAKSQQLSIKQGYMSKYDLADELRNMLNEAEKAKAPADVAPLLDVSKNILDIGKSEEEYKKLSDYLVNLATSSKGVFTPTLSKSFKTDKHEKVYPIPNAGWADPRRFGRLLVFDKFSVGIKKWLINNAPLYGFVMYEDYGLYFIGLKSFKEAATNNGVLLKLVNQFQRNAIPAANFTLTASTLQAAKEPVGVLLDPVPTPAGIKDNNGNSPDLVRIDGECVSRAIFNDYSRMFMAAKSAGVDVKVRSGFRPADGPSISWTSQSGRTGKFTTQVECRKYNLKKGITIPNKSANGEWGPKSGMDAVIYYTDASTYFKPQTARPGKSNHGTGLAVDLNTGKGSAAAASPVYHWLAHNSWKYGFVRGVKSEEWHFEHWPSLKRGQQPTSPFTRVPKSNSKWYNIFA